jgi:REP element-mobilizing transposase RayT
MVRRAKAGTQVELPMKERGWGGARKGAGRKPKGPRPMGDLPATPHLRRPEIERRHPVHVTLRLMPDAWNLRSKRSFAVLSRALEGVRATGMRLTHYSVQGNHVHLIAEVENRSMLSRAMRSLTIRAAKGLNQLMRRKGRVIADRYHVSVLSKPQQVRNAIRYVLSNTRKHMVERGQEVGPVTADDYAAGPADHVPTTMRLRPSPLLAEPRTWLLQTGWRRVAAR